MAGDMKVISPKKLQAATAAETKAFNDDLAALAPMLWGYDWELSAPGYSVQDAENLSSSEYTRRLFSQSGNVFVLDENGKFQANTLESAEELASYAASGRLYARDNENNLCQLLFVEDRNPGAKEGEKPTKPYLQLSEPIQPQAVAAPAWWKYILAIFSSRFSEEIQAYNAATAFNDALEKSGFINDNADREAPQDDLKKFEKDLNEYAELQGNVVGAVWTKDRSAESILNAMHTSIRRNLAKEILNRIKDSPEQKAEILAQNAATFETKLNEIKEFLPKTYNPKELENLVKLGPIARNAENDVLGLKFDFIAETALENFDNYVSAGKTDTFRQRKYINTSTQKEKDFFGPKQYCDPLGIPKKLSVSQMNPQQFNEYLTELANTNSPELISDTIKDDGFTPDKYYKAMTTMMESQVAKKLLAEANKITDKTEKEAFLDTQKKTYTALTVGLRDFVKESIDANLINTYVQTHDFSNRTKLWVASTNLEMHGVDQYMEKLKAENAEKAKENVEAAPQKQEASVEKEQSQPEKQGNPLGLH